MTSSILSQVLKPKIKEALMREQLLQQKTSNLESFVREAQQTSEEGWLVSFKHRT
jgi:hypothetical protein